MLRCDLCAPLRDAHYRFCNECAGLLPANASPWRPIDTWTPELGEEVFLLTEHGASAAQWARGEWLGRVDGDWADAGGVEYEIIRIENPTHYMLIPPGPKS